jgi:hypothetical protein
MQLLQQIGRRLGLAPTTVVSARRVGAAPKLCADSFVRSYAAQRELALQQADGARWPGAIHSAQDLWPAVSHGSKRQTQIG